MSVPLTPDKIRSATVSEALRDDPNRTQIEADTLAMMRALVGDEKPSSEQMEAWVDAIEKGHIDSNAILGLVRRSTPHHDLKASVAMTLLYYGNWGAQEIFPRVLDSIPDLNTEEKAFNERLEEACSSNNVEYVSAYLQHPRVDVNKPIGDEHYTILDECFSVIFDGIQRERVVARGSWLPGNAEWFAGVLLERGAIMDPMNVVALYKENPDEREPHVECARPFVEQWQARWDAFESGTLKPSEITLIDLGHFYSLGRLLEALEPERWRGHEIQAIDLYEQLPAWVQERVPCIEQRHLLMVRMQPETQVQSWNAAIEPSTTERGR